MDEKQMIEDRLKREWLEPKEWRTNEDGETEAVVGRFVVIEEDEDNGLYEGDEGDLVVSVVGAEENHNQSVHFGLMIDDQDCATEVRDLAAIEAV